MGKYLFHGSYTLSGIAGVVKDGGTARVKAIEKLAKSVGGKVESFHFGFGKDDFYVIVDLPDNNAAAATAMTVAASGAANVQTMCCSRRPGVDAAVKLHPDYRKPGG